MLALASSSDPTSSPYMFLTKVYPALTHACEDNWQRNYENRRRGRGVHEEIDAGAESILLGGETLLLDNAIAPYQ